MEILEALNIWLPKALFTIGSIVLIIVLDIHILNKYVIRKNIDYAITQYLDAKAKYEYFNRSRKPNDE